MGLAMVAVSAPQLVPVMVKPGRMDRALPTSAFNAIEIELPGGYRVRIGCGRKATALRLMLGAQERR